MVCNVLLQSQVVLAFGRAAESKSLRLPIALAGRRLWRHELSPKRQLPYLPPSGKIPNALVKPVYDFFLFDIVEL